jgi:hypothetical protein
MTTTTETDSRRAFRELLAMLATIDDTYLSPDNGISGPADDADGHRFLMHLLESAVTLAFETDPDRPDLRRIVTPTRKALGDNPDAIYFEAPLNPARAYRMRGNLAGAVYTSITIEAGPADGGYGTRTSGVINDTQFDVSADGSYQLTLGGPPQDRNWLALPDDAAHVTTRHYFEDVTPAAADPLRFIPLTIETLDPVAAPPPWDDQSIAAGIRRVTKYLRGRTVDQPRRDPTTLPTWVGTVPNLFPKPERPGDMSLSAFDAAYSSGPYALRPEEALIITGRWPTCRFASVDLWNRFLQTYDYVHRPVGRNRANTVLEPDGSFRLVLAHRDPHVPNWLDTEGRPTGQLFWRFFLPEGDIETPQTSLVPFAEITS